MAFWIFKTTKQELYPDKLGERYVYDNTHSVRVSKGDYFIYLDKEQGYAFTGIGVVKRIGERKPTKAEASRRDKIRVVFTAHLTEVEWFEPPLSISPATKSGRANRAELGIVDVNLLGWSQSMPSISREMFFGILDLAEKTLTLNRGDSDNQDYSIPDSWSRTRARKKLRSFSDEAFARSNSRCVVCGTGLIGLLDAAHLSPYATDIKNRANPANGICLCKYCHTALDKRLIAICSSGEVTVSQTVQDDIASIHFEGVGKECRATWLAGVDPKFLALTTEWFKHREAQQGGAANG
jgi:hypothetical protein